MRKNYSVKRLLTNYLPALALVGALAAAPIVALAGTSGGLNGHVTDAKTGAALSGVQLQISSPSQTVTTTTDAHGHYTVFSLAPDDYTITAVKQGYDPSSITGETIYADQTQIYDLQLTPSAATPP